MQLGLLMGLTVLCGALTGCVSPLQRDTSQFTALQLRAMQTRTYEGQDPKATLKTVLNVLQDEGFLVDHGNTELGLLHGSKTIEEISAQSFGTTPVFLERSFGAFGPIIDAVTIEATANVSDFGAQTKVRVNFQRKVTNSRGAVTFAAPVVDAKVYQEFFAKVERGLFIQGQGL
jgi:hypothetical protein